MYSRLLTKITQLLVNFANHDLDFESGLEVEFRLEIMESLDTLSDTVVDVLKDYSFGCDIRVKLPNRLCMYKRLTIAAGSI
jgi:hypothetical protein